MTEKRYYHASPHEIPEGEALEPGGRAGNFSHGFNAGRHVSISDTEQRAREWGAVIGAGRYERMHLYEVEPSEEPTEHDSGFYEMTEHRAPSARVVRHLGHFDPADE